MPHYTPFVCNVLDCICPYIHCTLFVATMIVIVGHTIYISACTKMTSQLADNAAYQY